MRIFVIWLQSQKKHNIPGYEFWESYWKNAITEAGYEWLEAPDVDWAEGLSHQGENLHNWREVAWNKTLATIRNEHKKKPIDICLSYLFPSQVISDAVKEIRELGIPCVNFFCDNFREYRDVPPEFYCFDLNWGPEPEAIARYKAVGLKYIFAPYPIWIPQEHRTCNHIENYGATFIGSRDIHRTALLAEAIHLGASIEIRGSGWDTKDNNLIATSVDKTVKSTLSQKVINQIDLISKEGLSGLLWKLTYMMQPKISDRTFYPYIKSRPDAQGYVEITQQSKVVLGINRYPSIRAPFGKPPTFIRLRDLEAPAMGACYLTEYSLGLEQWFDLGTDIETYRSTEEMVEKLKELELNPQKRKKMRCSSQRVVFEKLTFSNTISQIIAEL